MGDRAGYLRAGVASFQAAGATVHAVSSVYRTPPWGPIEQPDYYNLAVDVSAADVDSSGWLDLCEQAESAAGRERTVRWGPRTLDADVVAVWADGEPVTSDDDLLTLPHPRAFERGFVLIPWVEIDPAAVLPGHGPISALIADLKPDEVAQISAIGRLNSI